MLEVALTVRRAGREKDVSVRLAATATVAGLRDALVESLGDTTLGGSLRLVRTGEVLDPAGSVAAYGLREGDLLEVVDSTASFTPSGSRWRLRGVQGPARGQLYALGAEIVQIGREATGSEAIRIADEALSRRHVQLTVAGAGVRVEDLGSTNGTKVNALAISAPTALEVGDILEVGDSALVLEAREVQLGAHLTYENGLLRFNRPPRVTVPEPATTIELPAPPDTPQKRRLPLASAFVPVVFGVVMVLVTGTLTFLLFCLMGPAMAIWSFVDDRRSGRKEFAKQAVVFRDQLRSLAEETSGAVETSVQWRRTRWPSPSALRGRVERLDPGVWERRRADSDFLELRVGSCDQPSLVRTSIERGGDQGLRELADRVADVARTDSDVPAVVPLEQVGVTGLHGPPDAVARSATWLVMQAASLHSPRDLGLVIMAPSDPHAWSWAKWLPHVRALSRGGELAIASDDEAAQQWFGLVRQLVAARKKERESSIGLSRGRFAPQVLLVVQPPVDLRPKDMSDLLDDAASVGVSVLWIGREAADLPGQCRAVVACAEAGPAMVTFTESGERLEGVAIDETGEGDPLRVARLLAALRDVSDDDEGGVPDRVSLVDLLGFAPEPAVITERWRHAPPALAAVIGAAGDGPLSVDLRRDGPHGLVAGTTGSGKSELLQSLVASFAMTYPPERLTFILVDYKGGAAFKDCVALPHTVGFVTDLDEHLTQRALTSLRAELRWREHRLIEADAKDLLDMMDKRPDIAPPALFIVVDEFAALATEVPEFVDGVVDIAARGRSLGIHLLLATQKPGGVIGPNIQANTNLRISLRVANEGESRDVIDVDAAAHLSRDLPGRGYMKTGPSDLVEFQSAYVGALTGEEVDEPEVITKTFHVVKSGTGSKGPTAVARTADIAETTDLKEIVEATVVAARTIGCAAPRRPWLDDLPTVVSLEDLGNVEEEPGGLVVPIGMFDEPESQRQGPYSVDLGDLGSLLVFGAAGAGKTTVLRTMGAALARRYSPDEVHLYGLDFASRGLAGLSSLPQCGGVVAGDDIDRVRRLIAMLNDLAASRRAEMGAVGAASLKEYEAATGMRLPAVVLLLDGFASFWATMEPLDRSIHSDTLLRLVADGRGVGIHTVITADRRGAVPPMLSSTVPAHLVLRMANNDEYHALGVPQASGRKDPPAGRAFHSGGTEIQLATLLDGDDSTGAAQTVALERLAADLRARWDTRAPQVALLPEGIALDEILAAGSAAGDRPLSTVLGLHERDLSPALVHFADNPTFLVVGPDRSGRTTTLATLAHGLERTRPDMSRVLLAGRRTAISGSLTWSESAIGIDQVTELASDLAARLDAAAAVGDLCECLVVIDDGDDLTDGMVASHLETILKRSRDVGAVVVAALSTFQVTRAFTPWVQSMRANRHGLLLQPDLEADGDVFHIRLPHRSGLALPPGRGFFVERGTTHLVQVALPG